MEEAARFRIRPGRRSDASAVGELRVRYLGETARLDPRFRVLDGVRDKVVHAPSAWLAQDERSVLVAVDGEGEEGAAVLGYAAGLLSVWPPIWRSQRVGEVTECFVTPERRGQGIGRALLRAVVLDLSESGADVLRAPVPSKNPWVVALFRSLGFDSVHRVLETPAPAGD
jgi:ribosomal protein S18 acetylase RimI-like enzyme